MLSRTIFQWAMPEAHGYCTFPISRLSGHAYLLVAFAAGLASAGCGTNPSGELLVESEHIRLYYTAEADACPGNLERTLTVL